MQNQMKKYNDNVMTPEEFQKMKKDRANKKKANK